jgi:hypothetical protein
MLITKFGMKQVAPLEQRTPRGHSHGYKQIAPPEQVQHMVLSRLPSTWTKICDSSIVSERQPVCIRFDGMDLFFRRYNMLITKFGMKQVAPLEQRTPRGHSHGYKQIAPPEQVQHMVLSRLPSTGTKICDSSIASERQPVCSRFDGMDLILSRRDNLFKPKINKTKIAPAESQKSRGTGSTIFLSY